jgi:gliding motility-associated-like protein
MDTPINGTLINNSSLLQDDTTYYAKSIDTVTGCESIQRLAVTVDLFRCNIIAYNLVSINGDPLNDKLTFEDISYFPDNSLKIYNRYGKLVWETTGYNNTNNAFKGKANVSGVYMNDSSLPAGTYFYILVYNNTYVGKQAELTGYLQVE